MDIRALQAFHIYKNQEILSKNVPFPAKMSRISELKIGFLIKNDYFYLIFDFFESQGSSPSKGMFFCEI